MDKKRRTLACLTVMLLISAGLASCSQPPADIIVACDVADLIAAVNSANANSDTTRLILDPNCTYPFTTKDNDDGGQGPNALPMVTTNIIIEGNNATLLRSMSYGWRFFFITANGSLRLEDITLERGYALYISSEQPNSRGGAIYNDGGTLTVKRSVFRENQALLGEGGAIYNVGAVVLQDSTLFEINNSRLGGAVYHGGDAGFSAVIQDVSFERNSASDNGGAIYDGSGESGLTISGTAFTSNYALNGGAIYTEGGDLNISASTFDENRAGRTTDPTTGDGGAIYNLAGDVSLSGTSFNLQTAFGVGGTIYAGPGSGVMLREVRIANSKACHGGGALYVEGETEVLQTTLKDSHVGGWVGWGFDISYFEECWGSQGGAIYNTGTLALDRSLLEGSWAIDGDGDGVFNLGDLTVVNSTFHNNIESGLDAVKNHGNAELSLSTIMYSGLVNSGSMTVKNIVVAAHANGCINSGTFVDMHENIALDPACPFSTILNWSELIMDSSLSDNGGPTLTHHVNVTSPLINNATCETVAGVDALVDQRGLLRPDRTYCDIGAFEVHDFSDPVGPGQPTAQPFSPEQQPPGPLPLIGCLNRPQTGGDPICVVPCPDGADPGTPCNP